MTAPADRVPLVVCVVRGAPWVHAGKCECFTGGPAPQRRAAEDET